jgi:hypothetical protein
MKRILFILLILLTNHVFGNDEFRLGTSAAANTDTIPPPPPGGPGTLSGPSSACTGETSEYVTEVPVACVCQWYLNDNLQPETSPVFTITWSQAGNHEVSVAFLCSNGELSDPESISVSVFGIPQPTPIEGDELVCAYTFHTYSTTVGQGDSCQWTVNGIIQPGYGSSIDYSFGDAGIYTFSVFAFNPCGDSSPQTLEVTAQGQAPGTPSPIQGPGESCEGDTDTYTTTVGQGESCEWRIDGVVQGSVTTTLVVTWSDSGNHLVEVRAVSDCGTGNPVFKNVSVGYQPEVFLGNDTVLLQNQTLMLDAGNPGSSYLWSTGATTQTILVSVSGIYSVTVTNECGSDDDAIDVTILVATEEIGEPGLIPVIRVYGRKLSISDLPAGTKAIQVFGLTGSLICNSRAVEQISLPSQGIYFVRIVADELIFHQKIFVK